MKFIQMCKNIWKIEDLRTRLLITGLFVLIYRFGSHIVLPGVDPVAMREALEAQTKGGLMALLDMFSGGAFSHASIFALGIMPYISASIVVQLLSIAVPYFQKMQKEGESGRQKMNQITRYLTVLILLLQGPSYLANMVHQLPGSGLSVGFNSFTITSTILLAAGSMFVMWLGERITDRGVGNGISFIILIGIIARLPQAIVQEFTMRATPGEVGGLVMFVLEILVLLAVLAFAIMLVQGTRRIPVQYAKRIQGNKQYGGVRQYIPLKVNAANVMPIIFAQAIMFIPIAIMMGIGDPSTGVFMDNDGFWYNFVFALLIIAFTYFYTAIIINPVQMAENLKVNNGFIPGVKPGKKTAEYIDTVMSRIVLPGSILLAIIAILPAIARGAFGMTSGFAQFFGGTSLLIMVGVVLDTLQQIESHLLMRHYDGFFESGMRIKGRSGAMAY